MVEGQSNQEGLLQVYYNNTWGWVCANQWDKDDADVACRMMDFSGMVNTFHIKNKESKTIAWLNNMQCTGRERSLFSCDRYGFGSNDCEAKAAVICKPEGNNTKIQH